MKKVYKVEKISKIETSIDKLIEKRTSNRNKQIKNEKRFEDILNKTIEEKTTAMDKHKQKKRVYTIMCANDLYNTNELKRKREKINKRIEQKCIRISNLLSCGIKC